jgi:hypothetical protein
MSKVYTLALDSQQASRVTLSTILSAGKKFKTAKDGVQVALAGCVYQFGNGNPDWLTHLLSAMEELTYNQTTGKSQVGKIGRQIFQYLTKGIGVNVIKWDAATSRFKMVEGWTLLEWDRDAAITKMGEQRWDKFGTVAADKAFSQAQFLDNLFSGAFDPNKLGATDLNSLIATLKPAYKAWVGAKAEGKKFKEVWVA